MIIDSKGNAGMGNHNIPLDDKNIVFIGFMGVGKTTVGQVVAKKLGREFIDMDAEIEREYGMPCSEIFQTIGEQAFRAKEKSMIVEYCEKQAKILSLGGGAFLQEAIREVCLEKCIVILLDLSWEAWQGRLRSIVDTRPVLQGRTMEQIKELYEERQVIYAFHHFKITTDHLEPKAIADRIVQAIT